MQIASYIPNKETAGLLSQLFEMYRQERGVFLSCNFYQNAFDMLCECKPGEYDALFFGSMAKDLAEEIRERDPHLRLVYIVPAGASTTVVERNLWYCLPEPVDALFLFPVLDRLCAETSRNEDEGMVIKTKGSVLRLLFSQIEYVEVIGRSILFHLTNGKIEEICGTFSDYEARLLQWPDFFKVHRAYIVNLRYIARLTAQGILTRTGCSIPVSKHLYPQFRKDYLGGLMLPIAEQQEGERAEAPAGLYTILLVDDQEPERERWSQALLAHGCIVRTADTGPAALALAERERFDCVVLDVNLGSSSGFDLCGALREKTGAPVVFLSILSDSPNQANGFLTGGVDYITKDVSPDLFWLKIETRIKTADALRSELVSGSLRLDLKERKAYLQGHTLPLTAVEFDLLHLLMQQADTPYSPEKLYELVWGSRQWDDGHTVQLHLSQLCRKLENADAGHRFIETVWGKGYRFVPDE